MFSATGISDCVPTWLEFTILQPLGWNVAALADVLQLYPESCGSCIEIRCNPAVITDNYGDVLDRTKACFNSSASLVVRVTGTCPCEGDSKLVCPDLMHLD